MNSIRYHTLLDKQTRNENLRGRPKDEVLGELQEYVQKSIDFVAKYNENHKINGKGVISSVDLFNEIVSFEDPYRNMWEELYGISTEELVSVFQYALENKPDGVTYVYNEPFLENPERRQVVIEQLSEINELAPGLIDTIGNQMHIEMTQNLDDIRHCFGDLKKLEQNPNTQEVRNELLRLSGVGPKVADCILLFSTLKRWEAFPIDVWVRRVMNELYIKNPDETKVKKEEIEKIAYEKFGNLAGIAQQYLFYWKREA